MTMLLNAWQVRWISFHKSFVVIDLLGNCCCWHNSFSVSCGFRKNKLVTVTIRSVVTPLPTCHNLQSWDLNLKGFLVLLLWQQLNWSADHPARVHAQKCHMNTNWSKADNRAWRCVHTDRERRLPTSGNGNVQQKEMKCAHLWASHVPSLVIGLCHCPCSTTRHSGYLQDRDWLCKLYDTGKSIGCV